jgi:15-cis-phytoene synthase
MADISTELVRLWDKDRYLASLFAPDAKRQHLFALYAFDAEIARVHAVVSEPQIGEIRLQWWIDTLDAIESNIIPDHPLAQQLMATVKAFALPIEHLKQLIEARRAELYDDQFPDIFSLESYIAETEAVVMQCAAMILDRDAAAKNAATIGNFAGALGLARLSADHARCNKFMPASESLESVKALAAKRLGHARVNTLPRSLTAAVLPAALTDHYLQGTPSQLKKQWRLWRSAKSGRI